MADVYCQVLKRPQIDCSISLWFDVVLFHAWKVAPKASKLFKVEDEIRPVLVVVKEG